MTQALIEGRAATVQEAVAAAAALLGRARLPLVFGLVHSTVEAQRAAVRLAETLRGAIDVATTPAGSSALTAMAQAGLVTASLGAVGKHADFVLFWGCAHDVEPTGLLARSLGERTGRRRVAVDLGNARGPARADERVALTEAQEVGALLVLRAFVRGRRVEAPAGSSFGLPTGALRALATQLRSCAYGVIVHDGDPPADRHAPERAWALGLLAREANRKGCVHLFAIRAPGNAVGALNVLTWRTGFPAAVSFTRGEPRFDPGNGSGEALLRRGDVDAALVVGAEPSVVLTDAALARLGRIPIVRLCPMLPPGAEAPTVFIATAPLAATPGSVFRMDGVAVLQAPSRRDQDQAGGLPTEAAVLGRIGAALEAAGGGEEA